MKGGIRIEDGGDRVEWFDDCVGSEIFIIHGILDLYWIWNDLMVMLDLKPNP